MIYPLVCLSSRPFAFRVLPLSIYLLSHLTVLAEELSQAPRIILSVILHWSSFHNTPRDFWNLVATLVFSGSFSAKPATEIRQIPICKSAIRKTQASYHIQNCILPNSYISYPIFTYAGTSAPLTTTIL